MGVYRNALEATKALGIQEVDVMFLDIRLPGMTGLHFLSTLTDPPLVVLTTAYAEYALESYEFSVIDYLLKPISFERFSKAVAKINDGRLFSQAGKDQDSSATNTSPQEPSTSWPSTAGSSPKDHIFIKANSKFFKVRFSEILYIGGMKDYLKIHTPDYTLVTHQTMNEMEKLLPAGHFIRVHRSYIVAMAHIKAISGNTIEMEKMTIPIGISYKDAIKSLLS